MALVDGIERAAFADLEPAEREALMALALRVIERAQAPGPPA
jgi:hypothetical protein